MSKSFEHGLSQEELVEIGRNSMSLNFRQAPLVMVRGEGLYVWDAAGRRYIDFVGGIAVNGMGHAHPRVVDAVQRQVQQLWHVSNLYFNEPQILLSRALADKYGDGRVFLANSGAEANEAAIKLARRYAAKVKGEPQRNGFITFEHSFHGRTLGALAATGQPKYHDGFEPMIPGFRYAQFNDLASVDALLDDTICAVMVEPIQAEGGLILPEPGFLSGLKRLCEERGALLILDEVQVGMGRTGSFFAYEQEGIKPDIVTLAKALGAGLPIGALISSQEVAPGFQPGSHGSTFSGNAVACRAGLAVLEIMEDDALLDHVTTTGTYFASRLQKLSSHRIVEGARGRGFILGLALGPPWAREAAARCMARGLLVNRLNDHTLRFLPPLVTQRAHIKAAVDILVDVLSDLERNPPEGT
ncbi:MAG: acetylornithine/N-succinyldiaminopimelate aminotransferase [Myxococcota bacterium]